MKRFVTRPETDLDSELYWHSLVKHSVELQRCHDCGKFRFPPSPRCYYCGSPEFTWSPVSGKGSIYSWIVVRHPIDQQIAAEVPFVVALVDLVEGPRISGRCLSCAPEKLKTGMPVQLGYDDIDSDLTLPVFTPIPPGNRLE